MFESPDSKEWRRSWGLSPRVTSLRPLCVPVLSALVLSGCGKCGPKPDPPPPPPVVGSISVYPDTIVVRPGDVFEIRTRVFDTAGDPMGETDASLQVTISGDPRISFTPDPVWRWRGTLAVQDAPHFPSPMETIDLQASVAAGTVENFRVTVVQSAGLASADHIKTPYTSGELPAVAIWSGMSGVTPVPRRWTGFVGQTPVGTLDGGSGEAAVFSPARRAAVGPRIWSTGQETVEFHPSVTSGPPFTVLLRVWNSTGKTWADLLSTWQDQVGIARVLFANHRVGIDLTQHGANTDLTAVPGGVPAPQAACQSPSLDPVLGQTLIPVPMDVAILHVVFVTKIYPTGSAGGYSCEYTPSQTAGVIFLDDSPLDPATLAHELAHQLGLRDPSGHSGNDGVGHVANIHPAGSFDPGNVMWWAPGSGKTFGRTHFTLGQVYRMNVQDWGWLNRGEDLTAPPGTPIRAGSTGPPNWEVSCLPTASSSTPCPQLWMDIDG